MNIFKNVRQAVQFAFLLEAAPGETLSERNVMVRQALTEAGVTVPGMMIDAPILASLSSFARVLIDAIRLGLPTYERACIVAAHSRDWEAKRAAVDLLKPHYRVALAHMADDPALVERLVTRHYIALRERGNGWTIGDIRTEFKTSIERVANASAAVESIARELDSHALATLAARVTLPTLEEAHA